MNHLKTLTKDVKRYGNSGGVYLPAAWIGGKVEVMLKDKPPEPEKDIPLSFADKLENIVSIFVYGSYARGEQERGSDIDVIIVTDSTMDMNVPEELLRANYDIRIMSRQRIIKAAQKDILFNMMLKESRAILNKGFLDEIKQLKAVGLLKERIELARSSLEIMKDMLEMSSKHSGLIYPIIMRIKEMLLIRCIQENKRYSIKMLGSQFQKNGINDSDFKKMLKEYREVRDMGKPGKTEFRKDVFRKAIDLLEELVTDAEKKEKTKKRN